LTVEDLKLGEQLDRLVQMFSKVHQSVSKVSQKFLLEAKRYNYVTPTSYLELIDMFKKLLQSKRIEVGTKKSRLQTGLDKLAQAAEQVAILSKQLEEKQPELIKTVEDVNTMMVQIENDKSVAEETKKTVSIQEKDAQDKAKEAKEIAESAQKDLDKALPALDDAVKCLKELKPSDITEIKSMTSPPAGVKLACEAVCIMKEIRPVRKPNPNKLGERIND